MLDEAIKKQVVEAAPKLLAKSKKKESELIEKSYYIAYEEALKLCKEGKKGWESKYANLLRHHDDSKTLPQMLYEAANAKFAFYSYIKEPTTKLAMLELAKAQCDLAAYFYEN